MKRTGYIKHKRNPWITTFKVAGWCLVSLIVLAVVALWILTAYFNPSRITALIEKESTEFINGDIKIGKLDYRLWSTYPWLSLEVDSLEVISKSLNDVPDSVKIKLPTDADFLASVVKIEGKINLHSLIRKKIRLKDIEVSQPWINIVMVNDTLTNYNITRKVTMPDKIPEIELPEIKVESPVNFNFFSLEKEVEGSMDISEFYLVKNDKDKYKVGFEGEAKGSYQEYSLPSPLPLKFEAGVKINPGEYVANLQDLTMSLAGIGLDVMGDIVIERTNIDLQQADVRLRIEDVFTLLQYLPTDLLDLITIPEGLSGFLPLNITAQTLTDFHFSTTNIKNISLDSLPAIKADVLINNAFLSFAPKGMKKVEANDIYLSISGYYYPTDSTATILRLNDLRMKGEGISLEGNANVENLTGTEQNISGNFRFHSPLMETLSYLWPSSGMKISGVLNGGILFSGIAMNLGKDGIKDIVLTGDMETKALKVSSKSVGITGINNLKLQYNARVPSYPLNDYKGTALECELRADSITAKNIGNMIVLRKPFFKIDALDTVSGTPDPSGDLIFTLKGLEFNTGKTSLTARDFAVKGYGSLNTGSSPAYSSVAATAGGDDAIIYSRIDHTPVVLEYQGGGILQTILPMMNMNMDVTAGKIGFKSPAYLLPLEMEDIDITTDLNSLDINADKVKLGRTTLSLTAQTEGLKPFLTSYTSTLLKIGADINFDDVDVNQLSWGYYGALLAQGENPDSVYYVPPMLPFTASDSVCIAIPRNIDAVVRLKAKRAEYMGYSFSPLSTDIIVNRGAATLRQLTIGAPYCTAEVDWTYSTTLLNNIFMDLKADVRNFRFEPFYKIFPQITAKAPELTNFTGIINANIDCSFKMFPTMFMNGESLKAKFNIRGSDMEFARQGRIARITHLMLIDGDTPIKIQNMEITGGFHDDLLQLNPFKINFDEYQLGVAGINNTSGDMYYHLALEKSPFHMPFGVTIGGNFKHPEIRLGGTHINPKEPEILSLEGAKGITANIMAYLHHGWLLFVQEAAKYEGGKLKGSQDDNNGKISSDGKK